MKILLTSIFFLFLSNSYAQDTANEREFYYNGRLIKEQVIDDIIVTSSMRIERNDGKYYVFDISVSNNSKSTVRLKSSDIGRFSLEIFSNNGRKSIRSYALKKDEYLKIKKKRSNFRKGLLAVAVGLASIDDNYSYAEQNTYSYGNYSGSVYTGYDRADFTGNYQESTYSVIKYYDPIKAEAARERNAAVMENFMNKSEESKRRTNQEYLDSFILSPMEITSGTVNFKFLKTKNKVILRIPIDGILSNSTRYFEFTWLPSSLNN